MQDNREGVGRHQLGTSALALVTTLLCSTAWGAPPTAEDVPAVPGCPPGATCEAVTVEPPPELVSLPPVTAPAPVRELSEQDAYELRQFDQGDGASPHGPGADRPSAPSAMSVATAMGATLFGVSYVPFLIAGLAYASADDEDSEKAYLALPVAGPVILIADEKPAGPLVGLLVVTSALQTIGGLMWAVGAATDSASKPKPPQVAVVPAAGPNMAGLMLTGTF